MLEDVNRGINWVLNNAWLYGGDPNTVYITGQSAGAQLGALTLFAQVRLVYCVGVIFIWTGGCGGG